MRLAESKSSCTDLKDALPLTDVRGMAKRAQPRPPPATPPFQQNRHAPFNNQMARPLSGPTASKLPESRSCDEILSADTDDDHVNTLVSHFLHFLRFNLPLFQKICCYIQ